MKKIPVFGIGVASILTIFTALSAVSIIGAINEIDETNKFISNNVETPIEYINETELTEGLIPYRFEAERGVFSGESSNGSINLGHACNGQSLHFGEDYSGGMALRNIFSSPNLESPNQVSFTFNSNKNVQVNTNVRCGGADVSAFASLSMNDYIQMKVNNRNVRMTGTFPQSSKDKMIDISTILPLVEGENVITIYTKAYSSGIAGILDYIEIYTTAELTGFTPSSWDMSNYKITLPPMPNRIGKATYECPDCQKTYNIDSLPSIDSGLEIGIYEKVEKKDAEGNNVTEFYFAQTDKLVSSDPLPKTVQHKLTIQSDYVTFKDGTKEQNVWEFYEFPEIVDTLDKYHVAGFYNVKNKNERWSLKQFSMPVNDITVAPYFDADDYKTDLENAAFEEYKKSEDYKEGEEAPTAGSYNGKLNMNDRTLTYQPIHTNTTATTGFDIKTLSSNVKEGVLFDDKKFDELATSYTYNKVEEGWSFLTCVTCRLKSAYTKTFVIRMQNQGKSTINFDFWLSSSSGNPTNSGKNPHRSGIVLNPNEVINFELEYNTSNGNAMSYIKFNSASSELNLLMTQYVDDFSSVPSHNVTIKNIENSNYTVSFENGVTTQVKEGKSLPTLVVNGPTDHIVDSFMVNDDPNNLIDAGSFIMGKEDVTLTPLFRYKTGSKVNLLDAGPNGTKFIHYNGISGFDRNELSEQMDEGIITKGLDNNLYYEHAAIFNYAGGMSDTTKDYYFINMAALKVSGDYKVTFNLKNEGSETLKFTLSQPNASGNYAAENTPKSELITLAPGECKTVHLEAHLSNSSVLTYYHFEGHTTTDMRLCVTEYFTNI